MKAIFRTAVLACLLPTTAVAEIRLGGLELLSGLDEPLRARVEIFFDTPEEGSRLSAAVGTRSGAGNYVWEAPNNFFFQLGQAEGKRVLLIDSKEPLKEKDLEIRVGVQSADGQKIFRNFFVEAKGSQVARAAVVAPSSSAAPIAGTPAVDSSKDARAMTPVATVANETRAASAASAEASGVSGAGEPLLKISSDLHYVLHFRSGAVMLSKAEQEKLKKLADMTASVKKVHLKGWAGSQKSTEKRHSMVFNRAYTVKVALTKEGVAPAKLRIIKPRIALDLLKNEPDVSPRVVATLLSSDSGKTVDKTERQAPASPAKASVRRTYSPLASSR